jgi:hypothetical protein
MSKIMKNNIGKIKKVSLREIWPKEDKDFTVWLEENIDYLNDILDLNVTIESREEKVGPFRVDLYGEDNFGNKVIIENQLEKTDHTHLGQIITYLTNLNANTAIWITKDPTDEHSEAVDWLNLMTPDNISFYLVKIEAIRIGEDPSTAPLFTVIKRPSVEKKQLGTERKEYAQRHITREKYWTQFLESIRDKNALFSKHSPTTESWIGTTIGRGGISINLVVSKKYARSEIYINTGDKEENKNIFDHFFKHKEDIEKIFGYPLVWERMEDNVTSRIKYQLDEVDVFNESDWLKMNEFIYDGAENLKRAFQKVVMSYKR